MQSEIRGETIFLRSYRKEDAELLLEAGREASHDPGFGRWMPWCHLGYSRAESESFIGHSLESWEKGDAFEFGIFNAASGTFLGGVGLNGFNAAHRFCNLGYWVRPSQQKRGIAVQAVRLLVRAGFADLPLNRIEIEAAVENLASQKVAEKAGARREARGRFAKTSCDRERAPRHGALFTGARGRGVVNGAAPAAKKRRVRGEENCPNVFS